MKLSFVKYNKGQEELRVSLGDSRDTTIQNVTAVFGEISHEDDGEIHLGNLGIYFDENEKIEAIVAQSSYFDKLEIEDTKGMIKSYNFKESLYEVAEEIKKEPITLILCENNCSKWIDITNGLALSGDKIECPNRFEDEDMDEDDCICCTANEGCTSYLLENIKGKFDIMENMYSHGYKEIYASNGGEIRSSNSL